MPDPFDIQLPDATVSVAPTDRPAEAPAPTTGFLDNLRATRREMQLVGNVGADTRRLRADYAPLLRALSDAGLDRDGDRYLLNPADLGETPRAAQYVSIRSRGETRDLIFQRIRERRKTDPGFLAGVPDTWEAFEGQARQRAAAELQRIRRVQQGATTAGSIGGFLGGVVGSFEDPVNIATMPIGGSSRTFVGAIARSALENMAVEAVSTPAIFGNYAELGERYGANDAVRNVLFAGGAGAAFRAAPELTVRGIRSAGPSYDRFIASVFDAVPQPLRERWAGAATIDDRTLLDTIRTVKPEEQWSRAERDAFAIVERDADVRAASPFEPSPEGDTFHARRLSEQLQSLVDGARRPDILSRPSLMSTTAISAPTVRLGPAPTGGRAQFANMVRGVESGGSDIAKNPRSSATGRYQFTRATWEGLGGDWSRRYEAGEQERLFARLTDRNEETLRSFNIPLTAGNYYLAHFAGAGGAVKLHRAAPDASVRSVLGDAVVRANPFLESMTAADAIAWASRKMKEEAPVPATRIADGVATDDIAAADRALGDARDALADALDEGFDRPATDAADPFPVLRRDLFRSDEEWLDAQASIARSIEPVNVGPDVLGPTPRRGESLGDDPRVLASGQPVDREGADIASQEADGALTVERYVERRLAGDQLDDEASRKFADTNAGAIDAAYRRKVDEIAAAAVMTPGPVGRAELNAMVFPAFAKVDPLYYAGLRNAIAREDGKAPSPIWAVRDAEDGEIAAWSVKRSAAEKEAGKAFQPDRLIVEQLDAPAIDRLVRARLSRQAQQTARLGDPAMARFAEPDGAGAISQIDGLRHDLEMDALADLASAADKGTEPVRFDTGDGRARTIAEVLAEQDADEAAIDAIRACLKPMKVAA